MALGEEDSHHNDPGLEPQPRLLKILDLLDHIQSLGVDTILLGPLFESGTHGYDTADYFTVDRRLGTNETLKTVSREIHARGMRLVFDAVFNHTGRGFQPFVDVQQYGKRSTYQDWFYNLRFDGHNHLGDPFHYEGWQGHLSLVKLNPANPAVVNYLFDVVKFWVNEFEVDGLRLDAADCLTKGFMTDLAAFTRVLKDDFWLMGEVVAGDYRAYLSENRLDSITNYEGYKSLFSSQNDRNYHEIAYSLNRCFGQQGIYNGFKLNSFVDNHDVTRISSILEDPRHIVPTHIILMTMPGVPSIYYGSEWGFAGEKGGHDDWHLRPSMNTVLDRNNHPHPDLVEVIRKLAEIRKQSSAIREGTYQQVFVQSLQMGYLRGNESDRILVLVNGAEESFHINLPGVSASLAVDLLDGNRVVPMPSGRLDVNIPPFSGLILKLT